MHRQRRNRGRFLVEASRRNRGQTSRFQDYEQFLDTSHAVPSYQATPVASDQERSLDWDNYASDPSFVNRGLLDRRITRSFNVDDLDLSSDSTSSSVFELQQEPEGSNEVSRQDDGAHAQVDDGEDPQSEDEGDDEGDDVRGEEPPPLPRRTDRNFSVIQCSTFTCKPKK